MKLSPPAGSEIRRALVIDDDVLACTTIASILESAGFEVLQANNGRRGLSVFDEHPVQLVVTDILMPDKEGIETIVELRQRSRDVKIIAVSGGGRVGPNRFLNVAQKLGADEVLSKPFSKASLLEKVRKCLTA